MSGSVRETKSFLEELLARFFQTCTDSVIVCAGCGGMFGSVKGMKFYFLCFFFDINVIRNRVIPPHVEIRNPSLTSISPIPILMAYCICNSNGGS